ncbi:unnamed protein product [Candida verbasci]|uniref:Uncharacterized protein n=1 Tax=Candida verbasci TaxID=1227364 RepID=A0A9W4XEL3_9ASCO|nr:unnamed protein product [Candida verbasci]
MDIPNDITTTIYLISCLIITLGSIILLICYKKYNKTWPKTPVIIIGILLFLLNLNAWYFLSTNYKSKISILASSKPIHHDVLETEFRSFEVPGFSFINQVPNDEESENFDCSSIKMINDNIIESSPLINLNKDDDLKSLRDQLLNMSETNAVYKLCFQDKEHESEEDILKKKWFKFCGSSVWMSNYGVYFTINRIVYTKEGSRNNPTISILSGQIFNRNWEELKDYKFPNSNLTFPTILPHYIDIGKKEKKEIIGSEDPRVILNEYNEDGKTIQEPIVIFNARRTEIKWFRAMHIYRPLLDPVNIIRLSIKDKKRSFREKNWAPFMNSHDNDYINFIYNFNPLRIIKCDLKSGECNKVTGPPFNTLNANDNAGKLRGGTQLIEIPENFLPNDVTEKNKFLLGIARSHNKECGCLIELYRPHIFILSKSKDPEINNYQLDYVSSLLDFNIVPEPWSIGKSTCQDGKSVLIPNSIAYWDKIGNHDYMGITLSEADRSNKLIHIRGLLPYLTQILQKRLDQTDNKDTILLENKLLGDCSTSLSEEYCEKAENLLGW